MFTYDTEEHRVDLSEIYVPIKWVTHEKSAEGVTEKKLDNYRNILHKVPLVFSLYGIKLCFQIAIVLSIHKAIFFPGIRLQTCKSDCKRRTCLWKNHFHEKDLSGVVDVTYKK